jgi:uncharacterized delta-60 repeat protein
MMTQQTPTLTDRSRTAARRSSSRPRDHRAGRRNQRFFRPLLEKLEDRRLLAAGDLDLSFSADGLVTTAFFNDLHSSEYAYAVAIQADGKIIAAGNGGYFTRYQTDGSIDTSFGDNGRAPFGGNARSVAVQSDGKIVVAGHSYNGSNDDFAIARYNANGSLDTSFSGDGKLTTAIGSGNDNGQSVAVQSDGKIVVAGYSYNGSNNDFAVARYNANGSLDTSFDGDGKLTTAFGSRSDEGYGVAVQSDGKLVVAGQSHNGSNYDFAVARYNANGSLDTSFDGDGKVTTAFGSSTDGGYSVAVQSDGKIVVAGSSYTGSNYDFAVAQYNADGSLDTSFSGDGKLTTAIGSSHDNAASVAIQGDGKIVVAGYSYNGNNYDFAVARYEGAMGSLSASLSGGNLTVADTDAAGKGNQLTVGVTGTNLVITDAAEQFQSPSAGGTLSNGNRTLTIPLSAVTGVLTVNTGGGNDTLTVDFSGGDAIPAGGLSFNGGTVGDDALRFVGYSLTTADGTADVSVTHASADSGSVTFADLGTVTFDEIEPLTLGGTAADLVINLPAGADSITLGDDGGTQDTNGNTANTSALYDSTGPAYSFEFTEFTNPTNSLWIKRGSANDDLTVLDLVASSMTASLTIGDVGGEFDQVTFGGPLTLGANKSLSVHASGTISLPNTTSDLATNGSGGILLTTARDISLSTGSSISTVDGDLTLEANQQTPASTGSFVGIDVNNATITTSGIGSVTLTGKGSGSDVWDRHGIQLHNGAQVWTTGTGLLPGQGRITLIGTGGAGTSFNYGVGIFGVNTQVISTDSGDIQVIGQGGNGSGQVNVGVLLGADGEVRSSGSGQITVQGTGGSGSGFNHGVAMFERGKVISTKDNAAATGDIQITGTPGEGWESLGLQIETPVAVSTFNSTPGVGTANVTLIADSMEFAALRVIDVGDRQVTLRPSTDGTAIDLGGTDGPGTLGLTDAEFNRITAGILRVGSATAGNLHVSVPVHPGGVTTLHLVSGNSVTQDALAAVTIEELAVQAAGQIALNASNDVGVFAGSAAGSSSVTFRNQGGFDVNAVAGVTGVTAANGPVQLVADASYVPPSGSLTFVELLDDNAGGIDGLDEATTIVISPDGQHVYAASDYESDLVAFRRDAVTGRLTFVENEPVNAQAGVRGLAISPDGEHLYATGRNDNTLSVFARDASSGQVTVVEVEQDGVATVDGLDGANGVAVSPDGNHVYVAGAGDDAIAVFYRNSTTGAVTYVEQQEDGQNGVDGLDGVLGVSVSPDGNFVYAVSDLDKALAIFRRDAGTGRLTFVEALQHGVNGIDGLDTGIRMVFGPTGEQIYVTAISGHSIAVFQRNVTTGQLTQVDIEKDGVDGVTSLRGPVGVAVSPDGYHVYATSTSEDAVTVFDRDLATGVLTYHETKLDGQGGNDGLDAAMDVVVSPDGRHVYVAAFQDDSVAVFLRDIGSGGSPAQDQLTIAAPISANGDIRVAADQLDIHGGGVNSTAGVIMVTPATLGRGIELGGADGDARLGLTDAELDLLTAGTIQIGDTNAGTITVSADLTLPAKNLTLVTGAGVTGAGAIVNGSAVPTTVTLEQAGDSTYSGLLGGPAAGTGDDKNLALVKRGAGTMALTGANTYTGITTVSSGRLLVNGSLADGPAPLDVVIDSGAALGGSGTVHGTVLVNSGGSIRPGTSPGITHTGSVTFGDSSQFDVEIGGTALGTQYDQLNVTGSVTIGANVVLNLSALGGFVPAAGQVFEIIRNDGSGPGDHGGAFLGLPDGCVIPDFLGSGLPAVISYAGGDGNDVVLTTVLDYWSADDDAYETNEDVVLVVPAPGVLEGDTAPAGQTLTAQLLSSASHGYLSLNPNTGAFSYRPFDNFHGTDSFTYRATNGSEYSAPATVTILVHAVNDLPVARNDAYAAEYESPLTIAAAGGLLANDTDVDSTLTAVKLTEPAHGWVTVNSDGSLRDTPVKGYAGPDSFTYQANDGQADSNVATVSIAVNPPGGAAPAVETVQINDGLGQRSMVNSVTVTFTSIVNLPDSVFRLVNKATNEPVGLKVSPSNATGKTVVTLIFTGAGITGGSLADGNYLLTIDLEQDGVGSGSDYQFGAVEADKFFRFFGDSDGDRDVDNTDYFRIRRALNTTSASSNYLWYFDFDLDDDVDGNDQNQFMGRYRKRLAWTG